VGQYSCTAEQYDHAAFVKGASNTVKWGHVSGGNTGFWVSWYPAEPSVSFGDEEIPSGETELLAKFEVGQDSADLLARSEVGQGSEDLYAQFGVKQDSADLLAKFDVGQGSAELLGKFEAQAIAELLGNFEVKNIGSAELVGKTAIRNIGSADLLGKFEAQATADLLGKAIIRRSDTADLLGKFEAQATADLLGKFEAQGIAELLGKADIGQDSAELLGKFEAQGVADLLCNVTIRHSDSADLLGKADIGQDSVELLCQFEAQGVADLLGNAEIRQSGSAELLGEVDVRQSDSAELLSNFRVKCLRQMGGNWQRKMWFDGTYYWRGRYCSTDDALKFEYIAADDLAGNYWTENTGHDAVTTRIDASTFTGIDADFTVRGVGSGIPTTIHYSDGVDTWVAESDEYSLTGWGWENLTKVFDGDTPDWYRKVNLCANRTTPTPKLWAIAAFYDDDPLGKQWVKVSEQSTGGDITSWETAVDVSNVDNTNNIYGCSARSMGAAGTLKKDIMVVYKEGIAIRSRYYDGDWNDPIEDIDTTTFPGKAMFDFEHGEVAGENEGHIVYVDADESIQWRERDSGATSTWTAAEQLHAGIHEHSGVGIVEHGSGWLWVIWVDDVLLEYRSHVCEPTKTWYPTLANEPLIFDTATQGVIKTSTVEQPNTPDDIPSGEAVPICWIGETAPATPCEVGWGILVEYSIASLKGVFDVRQPSSVELLGKFEVGQDSTDLPARFEAQGVADLLAKFEAQGVADLLGNVEVQQSGSADFLGRFEAQGVADLLGNAEIQQSGSADFLGRFEAQGVSDLLGKFEAQGIADLLGKFEAQGVADLLGNAEIQQLGSADLLGKFDVGQDSQDLLGKFEAQVTVDLLAKFDVGQDSQDLLGRFEAQGVADLLGKFEAQAIADLLGRFEAQGVADLLAKFEAQVTADLLAKFDVGQDSQDLLGRFEAQAIADLLGKFDVGQDSQNLLGKFEAQAIADLFGKFEAQAVADLLANVEIQQSGPAELLGNFEVQQLEGLDLISNFYVSPLYLTADEMLIGGRDRRMDLGGLDREMVVGGRDRRMKIK